MNALEHTLRVILGLSFLPAKVRAWIFGTGTRFFETFNCIFLLLAGSAVLLDGGVMFNLPPYRGFVLLFGVGAHTYVGITLLICGVQSIIGLAFSDSPRARLIGGHALILSGAMWGMIAAGFIQSWPPLTTAMVVYPLMALFCWLAGEHVIYQARQDDVTCGGK